MTDRVVVHYAAVALGFAASGVCAWWCWRILSTPHTSYRTSWGDAYGLPVLLVNVVGTPGPQGSKRHVGHGVLVESSDKVKPWRENVKAAALLVIQQEHFTTLVGPVELSLFFHLRRPQVHYRPGTGELRGNAPDLSCRRPDLDKLVRSTLDALGEAGVWNDDGQVAVLNTSKSYVTGYSTRPGCTVIAGPAKP